jgi:hypothetical protein
VVEKNEEHSLLIKNPKNIPKNTFLFLFSMLLFRLVFGRFISQGMVRVCASFDISPSLVLIVENIIVLGQYCFSTKVMFW